MTSLLWEHVVAAPLLVMVTSAAALSAIRTWRRAGGWGPLALRVISLALLATILLGPTLATPTIRSLEKQTVVILVDRSLSMQVEDVVLSDRRLKRFDALSRVWLEPNTLNRLSELAHLRLYVFDENVQPTSLQAALRDGATGVSTRLVAAADAILDAHATSASSVNDLLLLTDGVDSDDPTGASLAALADRAIARGVRISAVATGASEQAKDVAIVADFDDPLVRQGQSTNLRVRVRQSGYEGEPATITLRRLGKQGAMIARRPITLGVPQEVVFPITPAPAAHEQGGVSLMQYEAAINPIPGEVNEKNNKASAFVQVASGRIRVIVFENEPYWETTFFIDAMRADPEIELISVIGLGDRAEHIVKSIPGPSSRNETRMRPAQISEKLLMRQDVVVLGRGVSRWFAGDQAQSLRRFVVDRGGSLVLLRSDAPGSAQEDASLRSVLDELSPVQSASELAPGGKLAPTQAGEQAGVFSMNQTEMTDAIISELPGMIATTRIQGVKALSRVWLRRKAPGADEAGEKLAPAKTPSVKLQESTDDDSVALAQMSIGRGRTMALLADGLWRWALSPTNDAEVSRVYRVFWARAIRWLAMGGEFLPGQSISVGVDQPMTHVGQSVRIAVSTRYFDADASQLGLIVRSPDGSTSPLPLSRADKTSNVQLARWAPDKIGVYEIDVIETDEANGRTVRAGTYVAVREDRNELLDVATRRSELRELAERTGGRLLPIDQTGQFVDLLENTSKERAMERSLAPAWDEPWAFVLLVSLLGAEWLWRRRTGHA